MLRRLVRWLGAAVLLSAASAYAVINLAADDPARWNLDPAEATRTGRPNDFLAAPPGVTRARADIDTGIYPVAPAALLERFAEVARAQPRVEQLDAAPDAPPIAGVLTFIQRSPIVGFPDYISVKAVPVDSGPVESGSALIVYSRSRYGYGDFGVNRARVEAWLAALE